MVGDTDVVLAREKSSQQNGERVHEEEHDQLQVEDSRQGFHKSLDD